MEDEVLISRGSSPYLFSKVGDYGDFTLRAEVLAGSGTMASIATHCPRVPDGIVPEHYAFPICTSHPSFRQRTGSFSNVAEVTIAKQRVDEWGVLEIGCRDHRFTVKVNGETTVSSVLDPRLPPGHIVLANKHSVFKVRKLRSRNSSSSH